MKLKGSFRTYVMPSVWTFVCVDHCFASSMQDLETAVEISFFSTSFVFRGTTYVGTLLEPANKRTMADKICKIEQPVVKNPASILSPTLPCFLYLLF